MKKVLILGTSHSVASCRVNGKGSKITQGRWHDYFKTDMGYEVTNISRGGITPQGQLLLLIEYLRENPDARWDLCLIEGRNIESTINIPWERNGDGFPFHQKSITSDTVDKQHPELFGWGVPYVHSINQVIDTFSCNRAIISMMEERCPLVRLWIKSHPVSFSKRLDKQNQWTEHRRLAEELIGDWFLFDDWDENIDNTQEQKCECGHPNVKGHKYIWQEFIKPAVLKLIDNA